MQILEGCIIFLLGLTVGSFLNVLIDRLPHGENPWQGRSHCDYCKKTLSPFDLIPLVSFLWLRGRCRYCRKKLSFQYPIVELATGMVFVCLYMYTTINYQLSTINYIILIVLFCSFLVIFAADLKYQIIPDQMVLTGLLASIFYLLVQGKPFIAYFVSGIGAFSFFLCLFLVTRGRGMGFGDVKLSFVLGLLLGFPDIVVALYLAFLTGAALSIILILCKLKRVGDRISFGPFLIAGAVISFFWGDLFLIWYHGLLLS